MIKTRIHCYSDRLLYWAIVLLPVGMAMGNAPMNITMGFLFFGFLVKLFSGPWPPRFAKARHAVPRQVLLAFFVFFAVTALSLFNTVDFSDSVRGLFKLVQYFLLFSIIARSIKDKRHLQRVTAGITAGILLVALDAYWQVIFGADFLRGYQPIVNIGLKRVTASFSDSNVFGIYLSALIPVVAGVTFYQVRGRQRLLMGAITLLALSAALLTFSRPTLLALYCVFLVLGILKRSKALIIILLALALLSPFLLPRSVREWGRSVDYNPVRFMCNDDRIAAYRNSLLMIRDHPFIGVGVNTFMKQYRHYKETPEYRGVVTSDYMYAHNNFLHMAGEVGLLGLGVFIWFLITLFLKTSQAWRNCAQRGIRDMMLFLSLSLAAFLINGLTESSLYYSRVALIFWYLTGLLLACASLASNEKNADSG